MDISGGLHASEIAGSQHTPQLAYELLSRANDPEVRDILDNVIFVLWPSINPDGQDIVVNWCRDQYAGRTGSMELYQKYIGHDNNRDSYMMNVIESRVIQKVWREWEPNIIYVHHQSSPEPTRMWIPPFADPVGLRPHRSRRARSTRSAHTSRRNSMRTTSPAACTCSPPSTPTTRATSTTCRCSRTFRPGGPRPRWQLRHTEADRSPGKLPSRVP